MIRFLLDMGMPRRAVEALRGHNIEAKHLSQLLPVNSSDSRILDHARQERWVVVTLDADFARLLASSGQKLPSVVFIRHPRVTHELATQVLRQAATQLAPALTEGAIVSVGSRGFRIRPLPIVAISR